ncbi:hypothetical protein L1887_59484 [Cichorium endivia]|nr:hypothetical protein L1887_59484 [Cichorium endivia]
MPKLSLLLRCAFVVMATVIVQLPGGRGAPMSPTRPVEQAATDAGESVDALLEAFFASHQPSAWPGDSHLGSTAQSGWYSSHPGLHVDWRIAWSSSSDSTDLPCISSHLCSGASAAPILSFASLRDRSIAASSSRTFIRHRTSICSSLPSASTVWKALGYRVQAKELRLQDAQREREASLHLFCEPDFVAPPEPLPHAPGQGAEQSYVGVWELLPTTDARFIQLILRGYYDYTAQEFNDLDEHPQSTGLQYWLSVKQATSQHSSQPVLKVSLERLDVLSSQALLPIQPQDAHTPVVDFGARLNLGRSFDGRPTSLYQEVPETASIINDLKLMAHLDARAFGQVR